MVYFFFLNLVSYSSHFLGICLIIEVIINKNNTLCPQNRNFASVVLVLIIQYFSFFSVFLSNYKPKSFRRLKKPSKAFGLNSCVFKNV